MTQAPQHHRLTVRGIVVREETILLIENDDPEIEGRHYGFPGGGVEPGESIYQALHREMREEAACEIVIHEFLTMWEYDHIRGKGFYGSRHALILAFRCEIAAGSEAKTPQKGDEFQTGIAWVPLRDFHRINLYPRVQTQLLSAIANPMSAPRFFIDP